MAEGVTRRAGVDPRPAPLPLDAALRAGRGRPLRLPTPRLDGDALAPIDIRLPGRLAGPFGGAGAGAAGVAGARARGVAVGGGAAAARAVAGGGAGTPARRRPSTAQPRPSARLGAAAPADSAIATFDARPDGPASALVLSTRTAKPTAADSHPYTPQHMPAAVAAAASRARIRVAVAAMDARSAKE
ncbi:hypothetical protein KFE25_002257, partial [Diacronema lutheri]